MRKPGIALLAILFTVTLSLILPGKASADSDWALGYWKLSTDYTNEGQKVTFTGRLHIERERGRLSGRIYFDVLGKWERLQDVEVTDDTVSFRREQYEQRYSGRRHRGGMEGTYRDHLNHGEWAWHAERE
jgi:hypothetical protein